MPIKKGSPEAHARAIKAAATRAANRASGQTVTRAVYKAEGKLPPAFPKQYHGHATRHVTRDLKMKYPKARKLVSLRGIRKASTEELRRDFEYMNQPRKETGLKDTTANEKRYYAIKDELRARANPNTALLYHRIGGRDIGGKRITKKSQAKRVSGTIKRAAQPHRKRRTGFFGYHDDAVSSRRS